MWKPSWLTSQQLLQFMLNCKNHPNLTAPVHHTQYRHNHTLTTRVVDFSMKVSSLTWLYTADWPEDTEQQESNKMVSFRQFGTTLTIVTAHIGRELFQFLDNRLHLCRDSNFSHPSFTASSWSLSSFTLWYSYWQVELTVRLFSFQGSTSGHYAPLDPDQSINHWTGIISLG